MCASRKRTKWILENVENNYRNMTDYVNRQVESSTQSDQQQHSTNPYSWPYPTHEVGSWP